MWFWDSSIWLFRRVGYGSFSLLSGFMKRNVLLIFHFDYFLFDLPFRVTSCVRWMIALTIGTFCFIFAFIIVMFCLCTFRIFGLVLAVSVVVAIFLTIKTTLWIWNIHLCVTYQKANFDLRGYVWIIYGQYVWIWKYQLPIISPLHHFYVLVINISHFFTSNHTSWGNECSVGCHSNRNVYKFVSSEKIVAEGFVIKIH